MYDVQVIEPTPFQAKVMAVPEMVDLFLGGGRGGGKSHNISLLILRHLELYREKARVLFVRKSYKGLADFELVLRGIFSQAYSSRASYNSQEHVWRLPYGYVELAQIDGPKDYDKVQGRSFTLIVVDELTQWADPFVIDMLRSNLRGPQGIPLRTIYAANPGNVGHQWVASRYVLPSKQWNPFQLEHGGWCVQANSTFRDNPHLEDLLRAWTDGDWSVARGAFFAGCLDPVRCKTQPWSEIPNGWETWLSHDFGTSSPSATYLMARSPGASGPDGEWYPRGSFIVVDELATNRPNKLTEGLGWTVPRLAEAIVKMCERWGVQPEGCADDACFAKARGYTAATIADEFSQAGVWFEPAGKGSRRTGWERMRTMLSQAGAKDAPGLYVSTLCSYAWATLPVLARDQRDIEDLDSDGPDHAADAIRYGVIYDRPRWTQRSF
jgi:Phage terminase large subunit